MKPFMRRREFITLLGGASAAPPSAWSLAAHAQQRAMQVIGYLSAAPADGNDTISAAFRKGFGETGYIEGRNVAIEFRTANNQVDKLPELAADLVRRRVAVIVASGGAVVTRAVKGATASIPIVFYGGDDPVATGLVASFNRPGGNVTGIAFLSAQLGPKRLGLLKELVPRAARYGVLVNPDNPATDSIVAELRAAAASIGKQSEVFFASSVREIDTAFTELVRKGVDALVVGSSTLFANRRTQLTTLAAHHRLPAIYYDRRATEIGGLMSYGASIADAARQAGIYTGRILKGAGRPAGHAGGQVRIHHQPANGPHPWPRNPARPARDRRRGD
jgi:putative ABC transport system substrate-binding protein